MKRPPIIFLLGPPGAGKTTLGSRACEELGLAFLDLAEADLERLSRVVGEDDAPPAEREGLAGWVDDWHQQHGASPRVTTVIVDAMARHLAHLRATGTSPRTLTGVCADLNAAGQLVVMYGMLEANRIMEQFAAPPYPFEFERKVTDRPALVARYGRNLDGFARSLRERGELPDGDR